MSGVHATLLLGIQVLFVGDSITVGTGADPGMGYVDRIAAGNPEWSVVNAGCGGSTTRDWTLPKLPGAPDSCAFRGAFEQLAEPHEDADIVHILLGTNDATGFFESGPVPASEWLGNVELLSSRFSGDVVVSFPPPLPDPASDAQARIDAYASLLAARALDGDAPFRLGADFSQLSRALLDGVHPANAGHAWMAEQLSPLLVPEPATLTLVGLGLILVRSAGRRRARHH